MINSAKCSYFVDLKNIYDVIVMYLKSICGVYHNVRKTNKHSDATCINEYIYLKEEDLR